MQVLNICIPNTKRDYFDYFPISTEDIPKVGARVYVPFMRKTRVGIMLGTAHTKLETSKIKSIEGIVDEEPILPQAILDLCQWLAQYYHAPLSDVLTLALPKRYREGKPLIQPKPNIQSESDTENETERTLNPEQSSALAILAPAIGRFQVFLLDGVTGSGKTEVYMQLAKRILEQEQQILIMVPEIGLTPQLLARFSARFQTQPVVMHSYLTEKNRAATWAQAASGAAKLVIGTRLALFTPMPKLGLIIIDEEHDASFKQQEGIHYQARDAAIMRAKSAHIPIILGSATPSLESLQNCVVGKYTRLCLTKKAENQTPVHYRLIDIRAQKLKHGLAQATLSAIDAHIEQKNQILVFINRRGFAPVMLCHQCGWHADCKSCDSHMTLHRKKNQLVCHHCGFKMAKPEVCSQCQSSKLLPIGHGTERIYDGLKQHFPNAHLVRIDRDEISKSADLDQALHAIASGEADILIGTQMIAKGHHFPNLSLVVILDADAGFYHQDFRALERLGQQITQVSGRAGRAQTSGEVLIQTHFPENPLLKQLITEGYHTFSTALLNQRAITALPPFEHMAVIRGSAHQELLVYQVLSNIQKQLKHTFKTLQILGPAPAPMPKKAKVYHMQLCLKSPHRSILHQALDTLENQYPAHIRVNHVRLSLDVDPVDLT